jgi:hypothetical protein
MSTQLETSFELNHIELNHLQQLANLTIHNILKPTTGFTFFNSGFKSDPIELFPSKVLVIARVVIDDGQGSKPIV